MPCMKRKVYLGDSVYADWDGFAIILTTENGTPFDPTNEIILEPEVWAALVKWVERLHGNQQETEHGKA